MDFPNISLEINAFLSRRNLVRLGLISSGAISFAGVPKVSLYYSNNRAKQLTFYADDIGILNFALFLEKLETAFCPAVIKSGKIINIRELEYLGALGNHEAIHEADRERLVNDANLPANLNPLKGRAYDKLYTPSRLSLRLPHSQN